MKGVDTNILVRFLVGDDEQQARLAYNLLKEAEETKTKLFVSILVVLELIWVLDAVYGCKRDEILDAISSLLQMPALALQWRPVVRDFVHAARHEKTYDLADLLIAHGAAHEGCETVVTFDKRASQYRLFEPAG